MVQPEYDTLLENRVWLLAELYTLFEDEEEEQQQLY